MEKPSLRNEIEELLGSVGANPEDRMLAECVRASLETFEKAMRQGKSILTVEIGGGIQVQVRP